MLNSKISKYVYDYMNKKEATPNEAKILYHRFEKVIKNNENVKKIMQKSDKIQREYLTEKEKILNITKSIEKTRNNEYSKIKHEFYVIKDKIERYLNDINRITLLEENNRELLANKDNEYKNMVDQLKIQENEYNMKMNMRNKCENEINIELSKQMKLNNELKILKLSILSLESCHYVRNKKIVELEDNLKILEDNTRCMLGMISLENSGILSLKAEYAEISSYKQSLISKYKTESEKVIKDTRENKQKVEHLARQITTKKKIIIQMKENDLSDKIKNANLTLKQKKDKLTQSEMNNKDVKNTLNEIKKKLEKEEDKHKLIFYLFRTNKSFDPLSVLNDELVIQEAINYYLVNRDKYDNKYSIKGENEGITRSISDLFCKLENMKLKLMEKDTISNEIKKIQRETLEKIANAKKLNSELLEKQRELSNKEELLYEKKKKLNQILLSKNLSNMNEHIEKRRSLIDKLTHLTEKLGKKLIKANPNINIFSIKGLNDSSNKSSKEQGGVNVDIARMGTKTS